MCPLNTGLLNGDHYSLDVEFGNADSFFSASKNGLYSSNQIGHSQSNSFDARICNAELSIEDSIDVTECELTRSTEFRAIQDSKLFDFVSRFVILSDGREAEIAGRKIQHSCSNIYHQYPTNSAIIPIGEKHFLCFTDAGTAGHPLFERVFYVRDEAIESTGLKRWIVHHRLIVKQQTANLIVRCCHPKFNSPLPFQNLIPSVLKNKLFRIREKHNPNFPFMAIGESTLSANNKIDIRTRIQLVNE